MNAASIFELSPSEKLQLVEDLWDDLAAAPEAVPVHDWQKQELARRKTNLMKNPASGLPWEEVKRRVRAGYAVSTNNRRLRSRSTPYFTLPATRTNGANALPDKLLGAVTVFGAR